MTKKQSGCFFLENCVLTTASYDVKFGLRSPPLNVTKAPLLPIVSLDTTKHIQFFVFFSVTPDPARSPRDNSSRFSMG